MPRAAAWIALAVLALESAFAQQAAQISGQVRDPSEAAVTGASVTVIHLGSGMRRTTTSGINGWFAVSSLPVGEYKITVRRQGFRTVARLGVFLSLDDAARIDFDLQIGGMQEFITIEGGTATINTEDASSGLRVSDEMARRLPVNGRTLQGLISLAPGVLATPATLGEAGQFSVNGQRPNANYFVTDGVSGNSGVGAAGLPGQFSGGTLPAMTALGTLQGLAVIGELREVQIRTSTFAPEFGRMPGAQVMLNTLAGSNNLHGEVSYAFRHERLSGRDFFAERAGLDRAPLRMHDLNLGLGGPMQKNKMFFFASAEMLRLRQSAAWRTATPSTLAREIAGEPARRLLNAFALPQRDLSRLYGESTAQTSWPGRVTAGSFRIDRSLGQTGALFLRYHDAPSKNRVGLVQQSESKFGTRSFTTGVTHSPGSSMVNDVRLNFSRTSVESSWFPGLAGEATLDAVKALFAPPAGFPSRRLYGLSVVGLGPLVWSDANTSRQGQFQIVDTLALTSGRHQIRAGLDYLRLTPFRKEGLATALAHFASLDDLLAQRQPQITYAEAPGGSSLIEIASAFAQDTWSVNQRLNLTYGVRWEYMPPPSSRATPLVVVVPGAAAGTLIPPGAATGILGPVPAPTTLWPAFSSDPAWNSRFGRFAPRAGLAYRLNRSGNFVLRAGAGAFYDLGFASAIDPLNSVPFNSWRTLAAVDTAAASGPSYGFARDLRIPYSWQWNVTVEGVAPGGGIVSAGWVGSAGRNLLRREGYPLTGVGGPGLVLATSHGRSNYQSFQANFRRNLTLGLSGIASYTWSHSIDNGSWDSGSYLVGNGISASQDRGPSNFDVRHSLSAGFSYYLPRIARNWSLHGIVRLRTGFAIDVITRENAFGLGFDNAPRPDLVPGVPLWIYDLNAPSGRILNPAAFVEPGAGRQGTLGRNVLRGARLGQFDAAIERKFTLPGESSLHFRVQAYNVTNTRALADPVRVLTNPLFGQPASLMSLMFGTGRPTSGVTPAFQSGGPRTTELSLSWIF